MATRIISWQGNERSTPSIVSIDSIQISSAVQEHHRAAESRAKRMSSEPIDDSFIRHHKYFFKDGNVTFLVDGTLYCVHQYFFSRDSVYFSTRFDQLGIRDHEALPITISLGNIKCKDFDAFLSILYPEDFEQHDLSYEEWKSVLHLSTHWEFASIRRLALNNIQPPTPHDRLLLARKYSVNHWVVPALSALCERSAPLGLDEACQMHIEDVVLVANVREDIRNHTLQVDVAEIPRRVKAAQAGKLVRADSIDIPSAIPTSGAVGQPSSPVGQKRVSKGYDTDEGDSKVLPVEKPGVPGDIGVRLAQLVEDSRRAVAAVRKAGGEDVRLLVEKAKRKAIAEAARRKAGRAAKEEVVKDKAEHAAEEEVARRNAGDGAAQGEVERPASTGLFRDWRMTGPPTKMTYTGELLQRLAEQASETGSEISE